EECSLYPYTLKSLDKECMYFLQYQEPIPCEQLVTALCDIKQAYTQFGGKCPFVVSLLYIGWDKHCDFQPCQSICSIRVLWRTEATCIGNNRAAAVSNVKRRLQRRNDSEVRTCFSYQNPKQDHGYE
uniref:Uncharacterized protein n=2 Tax=Canis lupus familiaris TaxID=9615 RepID=A0A8C0P7H7_CANLF